MYRFVRDDAFLKIVPERGSLYARVLRGLRAGQRLNGGSMQSTWPERWAIGSYTANGC